MICERCQHMVAMSAFSFGECKSCGQNIVCPHTPCYKLCEECSKELYKCEQCEREIKEVVINFDKV